MSKQEDLKALAHPEYWNQRYTSEQKPDSDGTPPTLPSFEWFRSFENLRPFFEKHLPGPDKQPMILHLGCGNSTLTADLHDVGYKNQLSVDFSEVVIEAMKSKYAALKTEWTVMDVRALQIPDSSVDIAIDKGTLDAFIHGSLWDPPEEVRSNVGQYVAEVARVLRPGGKWLYVTYRQPHFMKPLLGREEWEVQVETLVEPGNEGAFEYFGFVMERR